MTTKTARTFVEALKGNTTLCRLVLPKCLRDVPRYADTIRFMTEMNRGGRKEIMKFMNMGSKLDWVSFLSYHSNSLLRLFYILHLNPTVCADAMGFQIVSGFETECWTYGKV
jgi:hypothetical protein